jgi:hypothetical protein
MDICAGTFLLLYGFIILFMGRWMVPRPATNVIGFSLGLGLFLSGAVLMMPLRYLALKNEFTSTVRIMVGVISDLPKDKRRDLMKGRMSALAAMGPRQRNAQVRLMLEGLQALPEERRMLIRRTMMELMAELPEDGRRAIMMSMHEAASSGIG